MKLEDAVDLLDQYSNNSDEFDPSYLLLGVHQEELINQVIDSKVTEAHLDIPADSLTQTVVDALCHGICIGALMAKGEINARV